MNRTEETWREYRAKYVRDYLKILRKRGGVSVRDGRLRVHCGVERSIHPTPDSARRYAVDYTLGQKPAHYPVPMVQVEYEFGRKLLPSGRWETCLIIIKRGSYTDV